MCVCLCVRHKHDKEWRRRQGRQCERAREGWWEVDRCVCRPVCHCCCRGGGRGGRKRSEKRRHTYTSRCCPLPLYLSRSEKSHLHTMCIISLLLPWLHSSLICTCHKKAEINSFFHVSVKTDMFCTQTCDYTGYCQTSFILNETQNEHCNVTES